MKFRTHLILDQREISDIWKVKNRNRHTPEDLGSGGASKTDIEPPTKRLSQNGMTLKEYLDQKEEITEEVIPFNSCKETFEIFKQVYLKFYYWVRGNLEKVEEFLMLIQEIIDS